jgi:hypothetical protein
MTEFGQRRAALVPPLPRLRLAAAALVLGAALAGAAFLHGHRAFQYFCPPHTHPSGTHSGECFSVHLVRPGWVDPLALGICLLGLAAAAGLLRPSRLVAAALIVGAATVAVVLVATYQTLTPEALVWLYGLPPAGPAPELYASPTWTIPVAALVGTTAIGAAALVLRRR